ncbi:agmatinase [Halobacterium salinarum]|uniref:agmatinase n=1 Tax=Halobacterium salinarum TaxID=2242 RepID=UPI001F1E3C66|nr:agmatinase [Halobacterium salinarum]MCF2206777.1 agmatinase [Halobacterium salinarum]
MFPGASTADESNPGADADYVVVGAPLDVSTSFQPGTRFGPGELRTYAATFEDYHHRTGTHFSALSVTDYGDVRAWNDVPAYLEYLNGVVTDISWNDATPLLVGGEHTVTVAAVRALDPDVFVALDAHLDLRASLDGDPLSHSTVTRHALDVADEAIIVGARAGSEEEWERAADSDVTVIEPSAVADWTPAFGDADAYLSVDIDAADPGYAPGTGTPEPFGMSPRELRAAVRAVAPHAVGFDVVEVNDRDDGQAPTLGAKLLREFVHTHHADG